MTTSNALRNAEHRARIVAAVTATLIRAGHTPEEAALMAADGFANSVADRNSTGNAAIDDLLSLIVLTTRMTLRRYRLSNMHASDEGSCDPYPLVDLLSTNGESIATGEHEIDLIVDEIFSDIKDAVIGGAGRDIVVSLAAGEVTRAYDRSAALCDKYADSSIANNDLNAAKEGYNLAAEIRSIANNN